MSTKSGQAQPHDGPICRMVVVRDPDGNNVTLHQRKEKS